MKRSSLVAGSRNRGHALRSSADSFAWIFRTNLPPRRGVPLPSAQKRNFFGFGEIISVLANPGETLRSLTDARKSLEEARQEIREGRERSQLRTTHTFAPLPGFFARPAELRALTRILEGPPAFTVLCGASSVGKTALLREVLSAPRYHVLHFDLRIAGFADLASLYLSLSRQMEMYFDVLSRAVDGYEEFEKEAWGFKHDRLNVERLLERSGPDAIKTSDVARLMELFQSALLHYWEFEPKTCDDGVSSEETKVGHEHRKERSGESERSAEKAPAAGAEEKPEHERPAKRVPVIFFDEAHKLPALIRSTEAMKCLLDAMLVLTKQDRLCHVVHATSDSFYQTWLRQLNIMQHCKIICIGDCSKTETRAYFEERLIPGVPEALRGKLEAEFEGLYDAFGGKLVHWADYVSDFVNAGGNFSIERSSHFLQAYTLLNLQLLHASESELDALETEQGQRRSGLGSGSGSRSRQSSARAPPGGPGFKIYSPLTADTVDGAREKPPAFTAMQLLDVMHRVSSSTSGTGGTSIRYFALCRELGVRAVDDMVRARVLELRWADPVTPEGEGEGDGGGSRDAHVSLPHPLSQSPSLDDVPYRAGTHGREEDEEVGPTLLPTTPIVAYAMRTVLAEYEYQPAQEDVVDDDGDGDERGTERAYHSHGRDSSGPSDDKSDYMSLSDVSEY